MLTKQKTFWEGTPKWRAAGGRAQKDRSYSWLAVSGFVEVGWAFSVVSGQSFCLCPYLVWRRVPPGGKHTSQPRWIPAQGFLGGWQDTWSGISSLLLNPPEFSWLVFGSSSGLLIRTSCCETAQASSYYCALTNAGGFSQSVPHNIIH